MCSTSHSNCRCQSTEAASCCRNLRDRHVKLQYTTATSLKNALMSARQPEHSWGMRPSLSSPLSQPAKAVYESETCTHKVAICLWLRHLSGGQTGYVMRHLSCVAQAVIKGLSENFAEATHIMKWLAECARAVTGMNQTVLWTTPLGLPVCQPYRKNVSAPQSAEASNGCCPEGSVGEKQC